MSVISREQDLEGPRVEVRDAFLEPWQEVDACTLAKEACSDVTMTPTCIKTISASSPPPPPARKVKVGVDNGGF